jgi:uncharacterized protein YjiS (DUF1127 family)
MQGKNSWKTCMKWHHIEEKTAFDKTLTVWQSLKIQEWHSNRQSVRNSVNQM